MMLVSSLAVITEHNVEIGGKNGQEELKIFNGENVSTRMKGKRTRRHLEGIFQACELTEWKHSTFNAQWTEGH